MTGTPSGRQLHMDGGKTRQPARRGRFYTNPAGITARVCGKEAGSKAPVRGTRIAYEASKDGRGHMEVQSPKVIRNRWTYMRRICGAKVGRLTPGDLSVCLEMEAKEALGTAVKEVPAGRGGTPTTTERITCHAGIHFRTREAER